MTHLALVTLSMRASFTWARTTETVEFEFQTTKDREMQATPSSLLRMEPKKVLLDQVVKRVYNLTRI